MKRIGLALALVGVLSACQSSEERAENYYESAVSLIGSGDVDRGLVELRNVFKLNGQHREARVLYARTVRAQGNMREAYGQYLRLVEQYPGDPEGTLALAELALQGSQGPEAIRYAKALREIYPDLKAAPAEVQAVVLAIDYAEAAGKNDRAVMDRSVADAKVVLAANPGLYYARQIVISGDVAAQKWEDAETHADQGIALMTAGAAPLNDEIKAQLRRLYDIKLGVQNQLGDKAALEATLKTMITTFPEDPALGSTLVRWYVGEKRLDDAESWLRANVAESKGGPEARLTLVRFLSELRGPEAGLAELDAILAAQPAPADVAESLPTFRGLRAQFMYQMRDKTAAVEDMRTIIADAEKANTPAAQLDALRLSLAQMEDGQGNRVGAHALVENVLAHDATNVAALKLKGSWLVDEDKTDEALITLRSALAGAPRDPDLMTLMAQAHERAGNRELMAEMLSLAVETSNRAPAESIRYASYLISERKLRAAEDVLIEALRLAPANVDLLAQLARTHIAMEDWPRAEQDVARLREVAPEQAAPMADELQARILAGQNRMDDLTNFLQSRAGQDDAISAAASVIRAHVVAGRMGEALTQAKELADQNPDNPGARFIYATILGYSGQAEQARAVLTDLVKQNPAMVQAWGALSSSYMQGGDMTRAGETLREAIAVNPDNVQLQFVYAAWQEKAEDLEGAIATYEKLYAQDSSQVVLANNLASLLTTARKDPESLDRAYTLARRLRGIDQPAFQDTYGWIAFLRGDVQEALASLEPAAKGLPDLALVQYHLGRVYAALGRKDEAGAQFEKAKQLIGESTNPALLNDIEAGVRSLDDPAPQAGQPAGQTQEVGQ